MKKNNHTPNTDEALLHRFFAEHTEPIADNGFTERVVFALHERQAASDPCEECVHLRMWSRWLNIFGAVAGMGLLIALDFFPQMWALMMDTATRIASYLLSFDADSLLVQLMLLLHQLPQLLPSPTQLLGLFLTSLILTYAGVQHALRT